MTEETRIPVTITWAARFYRHVMRTIAFALAAFSIGGSAAVVVTFSANAAHPAYAVVSFLAWGSIAAALVLWLRNPPI